jgi:hypothetical protein
MFSGRYTVLFPDNLSIRPIYLSSAAPSAIATHASKVVLRQSRYIVMMPPILSNAKVEFACCAHLSPQNEKKKSMPPFWTQDKLRSKT